MELKLDLKNSRVDEAELKSYKQRADEVMEKLWYADASFPGAEFTGWIKLPMKHDAAELEHLLNTADEIRERCKLFIVIGIGGSYLGARAVIETIGAQAGSPEIRFAGNNLSSAYHARLLEEVSAQDTCICVISKSGTTTEPSIAFAVLKDALVKKYGAEEAATRIYAITDASKGVLREEVNKEGYESFVVPDDIGGRYSVLTPVGLLPIAVAGIDVRELLAGAEAMAISPAWDGPTMQADSASPDALAMQADSEGSASMGFSATQAGSASISWNGWAMSYALTRFALMSRGKSIEVFEYYEPQLQFFAEWLKQLFGESEGKEGMGLFPASLQFTADLHSMGQFLQEGAQIFFETVLTVEKPSIDIVVPPGAGELLSGLSMNGVNRAAVDGVIAAHAAVGVPIVEIKIPALDAFSMGELIYFFEMTCALTGGLMGVNPFNQPGVESYKSEMRKELQKLRK